MVASVDDLPRGVASGGAAPDPVFCEGRQLPRFPPTLAEASPSGDADGAYPMLVVGTQVFPVHVVFLGCLQHQFHA